MILSSSLVVKIKRTFGDKVSILEIKDIIELESNLVTD